MSIESIMNDDNTEQTLIIKRKHPYQYPLKDSEQYQVLPYNIELIAINMREE